MKRKLLLINPRGSAQRDGFATCKTTRFEPLGLAIVAALTPADEWDVKLIDENFDSFSFEQADLVALSAFTTNVNRAYGIAAQYRAAHIPTVIGGIHASLMQEEALAFVDSVVIGEAEGSWRAVLSDFQRGQMKRIYGPAPLDSFSMASPRRSVLRSDYVLGSIQTTRGCPMDCDFCSVSVFNGKRYRLRPVDDVLNELEAIPQRRVFFVDDNLMTTREHQERAIAIFKGMIERKMNKRWICQASINIADNDELLSYAYRAARRLVLVGVEAETEKALSAVNKKMNLRRLNNYEKAFSFASLELSVCECGVALSVRLRVELPPEGRKRKVAVLCGEPPPGIRPFRTNSVGRTVLSVLPRSIARKAMWRQPAVLRVWCDRELSHEPTRKELNGRTTPNQRSALDAGSMAELGSGSRWHGAGETER